MGKGDKKTKKGKIALGTFGVRRKKKVTPSYVDSKPKKSTPKKPSSVKKATAKPKAKPEKKAD